MATHNFFELTCPSDLHVTGETTGEAFSTMWRIVMTLVTVSIVSSWRNCETIKRLMLFFAHWLRCVCTARVFSLLLLCTQVRMNNEYCTTSVTTFQYGCCFYLFFGREGLTLLMVFRVLHSNCSSYSKNLERLVRPRVSGNPACVSQSIA